MQILWYTLSFFQLIVHSSFFFFNLKARKTKLLRPWGVWVLMILKDIIVIYFTNKPIFTKLVSWLPFALQYKTLAILSLEILMVAILFKDKTKTKVLVFVLNWVILLGTDAIGAIVFILLTGTSFTNFANTITGETVFCNIVFSTIQVFLSYFCYVFLRTKGKMKKLSVLTPSILIISVQLILFCTSVYQPNREFTLSFVIFLFIELLICLVSDIYLIAIAPPRVAENKRLLKRLKYIEEIRSGENAFFTSLLEKENEMAELRHDWNNLLQVAMAQSGNDLDKNSSTNDLLQSLSKRVDATKLTRYCSNQAINALLNAKTKILKENNISFSISCSLPKHINFDELDLCSVFSNLIDNAIEYCIAHPSPENRIEVSCKCPSSSNAMIQIKNHISTPKSFIRTTKADKNNHGYGLKIVRNIASKYNGSFRISREENIVNAKVMLISE